MFEYETFTNPTPLLDRALNMFGTRGFLLCSMNVLSSGEFHYVFMRVKKESA